MVIIIFNNNININGDIFQISFKIYIDQFLNNLNRPSYLPLAIL